MDPAHGHLCVVKAAMLAIHLGCDAMCKGNSHLNGSLSAPLWHTTQESGIPSPLSCRCSNVWCAAAGWAGLVSSSKECTSVSQGEHVSWWLVEGLC
jgi:hypothetical protein